MSGLSETPLAAEVGGQQEQPAAAGAAGNPTSVGAEPDPGDSQVFPLQSRAGGGGGGGATGNKQMANILCCLCGRSIQPNGEAAARRQCAGTDEQPPKNLFQFCPEARFLFVYGAANFDFVGFGLA